MQKIDPEIQADRQRALLEMLVSEGWRHVARPGLVAHLNQIARRLANARQAPLEDLRAWQAEFAVLSRLLEKPKSFFLPGPEEGNAVLEAEPRLRGGEERT